MPIKIFLLLCQIQGGELMHCSPPSGVMQKFTPTWTPPGPTWQINWPTWESCLEEAARKNAPAKQGTNWAFMCYASAGPELKVVPVRPAPEYWRKASDGEQ
jgi:hypothetical protein